MNGQEENGFLQLSRSTTLAQGEPLVGGVIGGGVDATMTSVVGRTAKAMFPVD